MDGMELQAKLRVLADAAKYDASCASSGSRRARVEGGLGNTNGVGICHSYTPDGRCVPCSSFSSRITAFTIAAIA